MTVPEVVMVVGVLLVLLAVGYLVWKSKESAAAPSALNALKADMADLQSWTAEEVAKFNAARSTWSVGPATPAATAAPTQSPAPVQATSVAGWSLGASYTSPAALLADVARPDFPPVRIDGEQKAGVTGFDFYTLPDGSVSQAKP